MNGKERVMAAVRRERPDRPASDLRCTPEAWTALQRHLGVETKEDVLDALDVDVRWIAPPFIGPKEVYKETTRMIDILGQKGGFIVSPSHQVQGDTPPENIVALFDAVRDYRW